jgi:hypothetical protein
MVFTNMSTQATLDQATAEALIVAQELGFPIYRDDPSTRPVDPSLAGHLQVAQELLKKDIKISDFPQLVGEPRE